MKNHRIPAALYNPDDYRHFMQEAGLTIDQFEVIKIPVELPNLQSFHHFIKALPLFGHILTEENHDEINRDITAAFQSHCDNFYDGKIICNGEMIIVTAYK